MNTLTIDDTTYRYPNKLDQLTRAQLVAVYKRLTKVKKTKPWSDVLKVIFPECPNLRNMNAQIRIDKDLSINQGALTQTMLERTVEAIVRKGELSKDILQCFKHRRKTYVGPGDGFALLTVREYIHAYELSFYYALYPTQHELLDQLLYCLYRPICKLQKQPSVDNRAPFYYQLLAQITKPYKRIPNHIKGIIFQYFVYCQDTLIIQPHQHIFGSNTPQLEGKKSSTQAKPINWSELITIMAKGDPFRKEQIMNERAVEWFYMKNLTIAEAKKEQALRLAKQ